MSPQPTGGRGKVKSSSPEKCVVVNVDSFVWAGVAARLSSTVIQLEGLINTLIGFYEVKNPTV